MKRVSTELRSKRIAKLTGDISEIDIAMRHQMQQREKFKNINELTKAIVSTETLTELKGKKRKLQDELTMLQLKEAKVKKVKQSVEKKISL